MRKRTSYRAEQTRDAPLKTVVFQALQRSAAFAYIVGNDLIEHRRELTSALLTSSSRPARTASRRTTT